MIVLNAGVPRSGTVLVNAILRRLYAARGHRVRQCNPHAHELPQLIRRLQHSGQDRADVILIHTHSWSAEVAQLLRRTPDVTGTINYRDPRDVCVSVMGLHDIDFETAMKVVEQSFQAFEETLADRDLLVVPYELFMQDRASHIFQIARQVGFWPSLAEIARIEEETSAERHRVVMERLAAGDLPNVASRPNRQRILYEDRETLINDRHIQSGASGRWRNELSRAQQDEANKRFADLIKRFGYG